MPQIKVCVVTGSRAEFGQLLPLLNKLQNDNSFDLRLVVTGSHVSGPNQTVSEIEKSGIKIHYRIPIEGIMNNSRIGIAYQISELIISFSRYFSENKPDLLIVIGDRYEMFAASIAGSNLLIPMAHICGGSTTAGALDEIYRHSITKMSQMHFTTCDEYRNRVIQLGEHPESVYKVGSLAIENCLKVELLSKQEVEALFGLQKDDKYCVVTFHPVTLEESGIANEMNALINAMKRFNYHYIITLSNADSGSSIINDIWKKETENNPKFHVCSSLGMKRYLSTLKYSEMMIGNSSSGTTEGPTMHIPSIDIGDRQKGRYFCESLIHCEPNEEDIYNAISKGSSKEFQAFVKTVQNPFGDGNTSQRIVDIIKSDLSKINIKKTFYDIKK